MPTRIERPQLRKLIDAGAQLVEVLPEEEYEHEHIKGAINIPLKQFDAKAASRLDKDKPVVVYCNNYL